MSEISPQDIRNILAKKEQWVTLSTKAPNGYPHSVSIGYFLAGDRLIMACLDGTQKVKNIERDHRVSVLWENGKGKDSLKGILFQGNARIIRDYAERMELKTEACRQRGIAPPTELAAKSVYIEITPVKTITWDQPSRGRRGRSVERESQS
jgi:nitroimidazol reductase NimA-like FMN-containing flavoprotein (pyridoxamine 5'-phosphate oxidase superfamily)